MGLHSCIVLLHKKNGVFGVRYGFEPCIAVNMPRGEGLGMRLKDRDAGGAGITGWYLRPGTFFTELLF